MENLINLYDIVSVSPWRDKYLSSFLQGCTEHQVFINNSTSRVHQVAADINSKLNYEASRSEGLLLLKTFLPQCPDEIFTDNAASWASQALNVTEGSSNENIKSKLIHDLPFTVLRSIIELSGQFPNFSKQLIPSVSKLLRQLTGYEKQDFVADPRVSCARLQCLQSCMKYYSTQCVTYRGSIEKLLLSLICCTNVAIVHDASSCFLLLSLINPTTGMKGTQLIGGGNGCCSLLWKQMLTKLVATMHFVLNELYGTLPMFKKSLLESEKFDIPFETQESSVVAVQTFSTMYTNLCKYLCTMLTNPLPAAKEIVLEEVLGAICQALSVTCFSLTDKVSAESLALTVCIPQIHMASISALSALMDCSRRNLLPFGPLVIKLIMQSLKWNGDIKNWPLGVKKPFSSLRCAAYSCLSLWLRISSAASCAEEIAEELIGMALADMVPSREKMTLMVTDSRKKSRGKHHKRQKVEFAEISVVGKGSDSTSGFRCAIGNGSANRDTCCAALDVLTYLLYSVGPFLKPNQHKVIQEKVVSVLVDIQRSSSSVLNCKDVGGRWHGTELILPYQSDAECRLSLYKLLLALVIEPHSHKWPPPLGIAAQLFASGLNDPNIEVSTFCLTSKRTVEAIIHPCAPTLNFPVSQSDVREKEQSYLDSLVDRVRAREGLVCESTDGEDEKLFKRKRSRGQDIMETVKRMDYRNVKQIESRSPSPEVITISDEPVASAVNNEKDSPDITIVQNGEESDSSDSSEFVSDHGNERPQRGQSVKEMSIGEIPLTTIQSVGVQTSSEHRSSDAHSSTSSSISQSDKVLVLKLPIKKTDSSVWRKDFTQQWTADPDHMEIEAITDEDLEPLEGNAVLEESSKDISKVKDNENIKCSEVVHGEESRLETEKMNHDTENEEKDSSMPQVEACADNPSQQSPAVTQKVVELDVDNLSEGEEMISCFADVAPDSE